MFNCFCQAAAAAQAEKKGTVRRAHILNVCQVKELGGFTFTATYSRIISVVPPIKNARSFDV